MKTTDTVRRWRRTRTVITAGAAAAGLLAALAVPANAALDPFPAPVTPTSAPGSYAEQVLASNGDNAIDPVLGKFYRIVGLADLGNGVLLAAYDGRPDGGDSPSANSIVQRRSTDSGKTWGEPTFIARGQVAASGALRYGFSDPSYVVDKETGTVFNFHVYSKDQGFAGSSWANDDADRQVTSTEVSVSTDGGVTWSTDPSNQPVLPTAPSYSADSKYAGFAGPLVTSVAKPVGSTVNGVANVGGVKGMFASSGEGIQLKYGAHRGRLIQQYAGTVVQPGGGTAIQAYSVYSDDHGRTWQRGDFTGTAMDENKSVELSDGRVMLNSRDNAGGGGRRVAISTDGGVSYGAVSYDRTLTDPRNNAGITRMYPDAAAGSADAKKLLFSNANNPTSRVNGTIRYSCDDGASWGTSRQFKSGAMSYSTVTALGDGNFGVLYEGDNNTITFGKFSKDWLSPLCASLTAQPAAVSNGGTTPVTLTLTNNDAVNTEAGSLSLLDAVDWNAPSAAVPAVAPGQSVTLTLDLTSPSYLKAGNYSLSAVLTAGSAKLQAPVTVTITGGAGTSITGAYVFGQRNDSGRDLSASPYRAGDAVPYQFRVYNAGNITESVRPAGGNFYPFIPADGAGNCRFGALAVGASYLCATPKHAVTPEDAAQGFFVPTSSWVTGPDNNTVDKTFTVIGDEVDLMVRNPGLSGSVSGQWNDIDGNGFADAGDTIGYSYTVDNSGNVPLTGLSAPAIGLSQSALAVADSVTVTGSYTLTAADIAAKQVAGVSVPVTASNGAKTAAFELVGQPIALKTAPERPGFTPDVSGTKLKGTPPVDLALGAGKYKIGDPVTVHNVPAGQWYFVYLEKAQVGIGWIFAGQDGTVQLTVPAGAKNGNDTLGVLDSSGNLLSFGNVHITPKG